MTKKQFNAKLVKLTEEQILKLESAEPSGQILNVLNGFNKHCFGVMFDQPKKHVSYQLFYVFNSYPISGYMIELSTKLNGKNELLFLFCKKMCLEFKVMSETDLFNRFQYQIQTALEKLGFVTYTDSLVNRIGNNQHISMVFHNVGKIQNVMQIYTPFINLEFDNPKKPLKRKTSSVKEDNYVYLMKNNNNGYHKIGRSKYPFIREKTLQTEEPDITLVKKWNASKSVETSLHRHFASKRLRGEWFNLNKGDLNEFYILIKTLI